MGRDFRLGERSEYSPTPAAVLLRVFREPGERPKVESNPDSHAASQANINLFIFIWRARG